MANKLKPLPWDNLMKKSSLPKIISDWVSAKTGGRKTAEMDLGQYYIFDRKVLDKVFGKFKDVKVNNAETFKRGNDPIDIPPVLRGKPLLNIQVGRLMLDEMEELVKKNFNNRQDQFKTAYREKYDIMYGRGGKNLRRATSEAPTNAHRWIVKHYKQVQDDWKNVIAPDITDILINKMLSEKSISPAVARALQETDLLSSAIRGDENAQASALNIDGKAVAQENALGMQLGHGEYGKPVSGLQAEAISALIDKEYKAGKIDQRTYMHMKSKILEFEDEQKYKLNTEAVDYDPKKGKFEIKANLVISSQLASANKLDAADAEQRLIEELLFMMTAQERTGGGIGFFLGIDVADKHVERTAKTFRDMGIEVKTSLQKRKQLKLDAKKGDIKRQTAKDKIRVENTIITGMGTIGLKDFVNHTNKKMQKSKGNLNSGQKGVSYEVVKNRVRNKLHEEIKQRMEYPRLQYDSGAFAESVQLKSLLQTGDKLRAEYTYNLERYNTFEAGGRLHTPSRDPRKLIEEVLTRLVYSEGQVIPNIYKRV